MVSQICVYLTTLLMDECAGGSSKKPAAPALQYKDVAAGVRAWDATDFLQGNAEAGT